MSLGSWLRNLFSPRPGAGLEVELGRNDLCWCGSGKKYKKCHLKSDELKRAEARYSAQVTVKNRIGDGIMPGKTKPRKLEKAAEPGGKR